MVRFKDALDPKCQKNKSFVGYLIFRDQLVCEVLVQKKFLKIGNKKMQVEKFDKNHSSKKLEREFVKLEEETDKSDVSSSNDHAVKPTSRAYFNHRVDYYHSIVPSMASRHS